MSHLHNDFREWLESDGLGGFASGTVSGVRTRRYHALLLSAIRPPAGRVVLVNGFDAWVETPIGTYPISTHEYFGGVIWPNGRHYLCNFTIEPWPTWDFAVTPDVAIRQELFVPRDVTGVAIRWTVRGDRSGVQLHVRPFLSGRDYHSLHHENPSFRFDAERANRGGASHSPPSPDAQDPACSCVVWQPYADVPRVFAESNAAYENRPKWFRSFAYEQERQRGLDFTEDLASPGEFHWDVASGDAVLLLGASRPFSELTGHPELPPTRTFLSVEAGERRRRTAIAGIERAADAYFARRGDRTTIIAGYPWFTDWGRDTFIAMRGLCRQPDRLWMGREILLAWAEAVSEGMLPNRFPDYGDEPEYNSVDASLWYIVAVHDFLEAVDRSGRDVSRNDREALRSAVDAILSGYARGTRYGIQLDDDGLLAAGRPGVQLTWMDAKVGDWVVTPRIGKPVEVQALWLNALSIAGKHDPRWHAILQLGRTSFSGRFWNEAGGYLYDVVDVDHHAGAVDDTFRPNQIFGVGGLPLQLLDGERARRVVAAVESRLLTPLGLRSLAPDHRDYQPRYEGGVWERDGAYHQGTVWPWLIGPFVEAWVRVRDSSSKTKRAARQRFVEPLLQQLDEAGLGHISEVADAEPPHTPRGCPFQAWSLGELLRLSQDVLRDEPAAEAESDAFGLPPGVASDAPDVS